MTIYNVVFKFSVIDTKRTVYGDNPIIVSNLLLIVSRLKIHNIFRLLLYVIHQRPYIVCPLADVCDKINYGDRTVLAGNTDAILILAIITTRLSDDGGGWWIGHTAMFSPNRFRSYNPLTIYLDVYYINVWSNTTLIFL